MHLPHPAEPRRAPRAALVVALLATVASLLGACGEQESEPPVSETLPACEEIWVGGRTLPEDYDGCRDADGVLQVSNGKGCTAGEGTFVTFGARYFALRGEEISDEGQTSSAYDAAYLACFGSSW